MGCPKRSGRSAALVAALDEKQRFCFAWKAVLRSHLIGYAMRHLRELYRPPYGALITACGDGASPHGQENGFRYPQIYLRAQRRRAQTGRNRKGHHGAPCRAAAEAVSDPRRGLPALSAGGGDPRISRRRRASKLATSRPGCFGQRAAIRFAWKAAVGPWITKADRPPVVIQARCPSGSEPWLDPDPEDPTRSRTRFRRLVATGGRKRGISAPASPSRVVVMRLLLGGTPSVG